MRPDAIFSNHLDHSGKPGTVVSIIAVAGFFLLFPGFLFYHQLVAMDIIPPFAGGLFGYVSLGTLLVFLALLAWNTDWLAQVAKNYYVLFVLAFLLYTSAWTLAHYLLLDGDYITKASLQSVETIILWSCLFLIGLLLPLEASFLRWSFFISCLIILAFLVNFSISTGADIYIARSVYGNTTDVSTYQGYARSALITLLFLLAVFTTLKARAFFILAGVFVLFLLASRSDFYAFLALSVGLCVILGIKNPRYFLILALLCLELVVLAKPEAPARLLAFIELPSSEEADKAANSGKPASAPAADESLAAPAPAPPPAKSPHPHRIVQALDLTSSKSWISRQYLQQVALGQIAEQPLLGNFGGHVTGNHTGRYAHNALSAWVTYGLVGFLMYASLTLVGLSIPAWKVVLQQQDTPLWTFALMINFVCLLLVVAAKSVYWPLPALGWGVLAQALVNSASHRS